MSDFFSQRIITARKDHACECFLSPSKRDRHRYRRHTIHAGQRYARVAQVFDGEFSVSKICLVHKAMIEHLFDTERELLSDGIDYSRMREYYDHPEFFNTLRAVRVLHRALRATP